MSRHIMDHIIQLPKCSSAMSDLYCKECRILLEGFHTVTLAVGNTLLANDGDTLFTHLMKTQVGGCPITTTVVEGVKSTVSDSIERRVLKVLLCTSFLSAKVARWLDTRTDDEKDPD